MTTISAEVIAASEAPGRSALYTVRCRYPRFIHAELMTHRAFSRNASSSRAIPVERLIADVERDPVVPLFWTGNRPGMKGTPDYNAELMDLGDGQPMTREEAWEEAMLSALVAAQRFHRAGYHKQVVNRLLEPFAHIDVLITSTEWDNFFALRCHEAAEPHMRLLAERVRDAVHGAMPSVLPVDGWHLPFVDVPTVWNPGLDDGVPHTAKLSVARCARVTAGTTREGRAFTEDEDLALYERLVAATPMHASPLEHVAVVDGTFASTRTYSYRHQSGNLSSGWRQLREIVEQGVG